MPLMRRCSLAIVILALATACSAPAEVGPTPITLAGPAQEASDPSGLAPLTSEAPTAASVDPLAPTPTVRPGMEATDPTTVSLAPGDPTLVEFFAFW